MQHKNNSVSLQWWLVLGAVLATVLLAPTGHGAVIKRENSISEQELVADELLAASIKLENTTKDNDAIRDQNRISEAESLVKLADDQETKAENIVNGGKAAALVLDDNQEEEDDADDSTAEPFGAADASATDTPIPTFPPSIDR